MLYYYYIRQTHFLFLHCQSNFLDDFVVLPCFSLPHDRGDWLQVSVNVSNTGVNTYIWLGLHKPEGAFRNLV